MLFLQKSIYACGICHIIGKAKTRHFDGIANRATTDSYDTVGFRKLAYQPYDILPRSMRTDSRYNR